MTVKLFASRFSVAGSNSTTNDWPSAGKGSGLAVIITDRPSYVNATPPREDAECCSLNFWKIARSLDAGCNFWVFMFPRGKREGGRERWMQGGGEEGTEGERGGSNVKNDRSIVILLFERRER